MSDYVYKNDHGRRGVALVFVNKEFDASTRQSKRDGATKDMQHLSALFSKLGFEPRVFWNLTATGMLKEARKVAKEDHSDCDCLAVAISSHGTVKENRLNEDIGVPDIEMYEAVDYIYGTDAAVDLGEFLSIFNETNCRSLKGKPKLFFIQGCRGDQLSETVTIPSSKNEKNVLTGDAHVPQTGGAMPDLLKSVQPHEDRSDTVDAVVYAGATSPPPTNVPGHRILLNGDVSSYEMDSEAIVTKMHDHRIDGPKREHQPMEEVPEEEDRSEPHSKIARHELVTGSGRSDHSGEMSMEEATPPKEKIVSRRNIISRDFLIFWSCPAGYYAFHSRAGSPFIRYLNDVLTEKYRETDFLTMLTEVNYKVATEYESRCKDATFHQRHIVPSIEHMLLREIMFEDNK